MRRTEAWWVCWCGEAVSRVGKKNGTKKHLEHKKKCPKACYGIKQIEQRKRA